MNSAQRIEEREIRENAVRAAANYVARQNQEKMHAKFDFCITAIVFAGLCLLALMILVTIL